MCPGVMKCSQSVILGLPRSTPSVLLLITATSSFALQYSTMEWSSVLRSPLSRMGSLAPLNVRMLMSSKFSSFFAHWSAYLLNWKAVPIGKAFEFTMNLVNTRSSSASASLSLSEIRCAVTPPASTSAVPGPPPPFNCLWLMWFLLLIKVQYKIYFTFCGLCLKADVDCLHNMRR